MVVLAWIESVVCGDMGLNVNFAPFHIQTVVDYIDAVVFCGCDKKDTNMVDCGNAVEEDCGFVEKDENMVDCGNVVEEDCGFVENIVDCVCSAVDCWNAVEDCLIFVSNCLETAMLFFSF